MKNRSRRPLAEINVVPYIDVMLVLLVIFMVTTPLLTQGVSVQLPQGHAKALPSNEKPVVVSVNARGELFLNVSDTPTTPLQPQALLTEVAARAQIAQNKHQAFAVYVKGDRDARYQNIMQAMVLLQKAGIAQVGLITEPAST